MREESPHQAVRPAEACWAKALCLTWRPFGVFLAFLTVDRFLPFPIEWNYTVRFGIVFALLITLSRSVIPRRISHPVGSIVLGLAVFCIWIGPDVLWPAYRQSWLFQNSIVGTPQSSLPLAAKGNVAFLVFRVLTSVVNVPVLEELFWRGWLMRWLISTDFRKVPLGSYTAQSFWLVAVRVRRGTRIVLGCWAHRGHSLQLVDDPDA